MVISSRHMPLRVKDEVESHYMKRRSDCKLIRINNNRIDVCGSTRTHSHDTNMQEPKETSSATSLQRSARWRTRRRCPAVAALRARAQRTQTLLDGFERRRLAALVCIERRAHGAHDIRRRAAAHDDDLLVVKANCGIPEFIDGAIRYGGTAELMADYARLAVDAGARIVGGCCGTTTICWW